MRAAIRWGAWAVSAVLALTLLTQPVSTHAQLQLGLAIIATLAALWLVPRSSTARFLFLALGSFVVLRYMYWRATSTLPPMGDPLSFGLGFVLLLAEIYCVVILAISLIVNADPLTRKPLPRSADDALPTVDIFIPTYNEDEYILATTVAAAMSIDYPRDKLKVWLLDDGGSDQKCADANPAKAAAAKQRRLSLQSLCEDLGATYLTRARNEHAKAGNLNNGLKHAKGDVVVVLDADHAPFRSFLRETVGHFAADDRLFLVQTPHVFLNPDPIERNLKSFDRMPSENEMFYSITQRGLDKWNGSFFCGSAALLRRTALDAAGGFSGITITEDCETAFELHSRGMTSVFVDKPLIAGLQPETFTEFISQRSRWCQGMFQILMLKNPLFKRGLKPIQRLAYLSSMMYWFFPIPRLMFMFAPLLHIFFDVKIFVSNVDEAIAYTAFYMVVSTMMQNYLYGHVRWPWVSELYEYVQGVYLIKAIGSVMLKPRSPTFKVTAKGISLDRNQLSGLAWPFFAIFGLLLAGGLTAGYRYLFEPGVTNLMLVVGLWNCFNLVIAGVALGVVAERKQPDRNPRLKIDRRGILTIDGEEISVAIDDVCVDGCAVRVSAATASRLVAGTTRARLTVAALDGPASPRPEETLPALVRHVTPVGNETKIGLEFDGITTREYYALAELMYADAGRLEAFLKSRRVHKNLVVGTARFIAWGLTEPLRAFSYMFLRAPEVERAAVPVMVATETTVTAPIAPAEMASAPTIAPVAADGVRAPLALTTVAPATVAVAPVPAEAVAPANDVAAVATVHAPAVALSPVTIAPQPLPAIAAGAPSDLTSEWLKQLLDLANWELRNADRKAAQAPRPAGPVELREAKKLSRAA